MARLGQIFITIIHGASRIAGVIATVFVMSIMVLTVSDVLLRFFLNRPIPGSVELCQYFIVVGGFMGLAWCAIKGGHVKVDMIVDLLPPRFKSIANCINFMIALSVVPLAAWQLFVHARVVQLERITSDNLEIPAYPFYALAGLGYGLLGLVMIVLLVKSLLAFTRGETERKE